MDHLETLRGGLVVSCQPVTGGPMDHPEIVAAMAQAAVAGGAAGVRIEGVDNLRAARARLSCPVIGLVKRDLPDSPVRITCHIGDVDALCEAGADIIAYDGTDRPRPDGRDALLARILARGRLGMADCARIGDARHALAQGAAIVGTTLSGYTLETGPAGPGPDFDLITAFRGLGGFVMAEGRIGTPADARKARAAGADAITVGSALTRLELMTHSFLDALS